MKKRQKFLCWSCGRKYSLYKEITTQQTLIVPCPYCHAEAVVKLEPYRKEMKTVIRGDEAQDQALGYEYLFPDAIPTQKPD